MMGKHAAARRALDQSLLDQVGLDHFFYDVALVGERRRNCLGTYWAATIILGDAAQVAAIHCIEPAGIDLEPVQGGVGGPRVDAGETVDRGEVAHAAQEPRCDAGCAARAPSDLHRTIGGKLHAEDPTAPADDALELLRFIKDEAQRDAEALAQGPRDEAGAGRRADEGEWRQVDAHRA